MRWSPQQQAIFDWVERGDGSAIIEAVAGAGKTTTLVEAARRMRGSVALLAFNKKIADELKTRLNGANPQMRAGTFHSFGFSAWRRVAPNVKVDEKKVAALVSQLGVPEQRTELVRQLVSFAKQRALGVLRQTTDLRAWYEIVDHYDLDTTEEDGQEAPDIELAIRDAQRVLAASVAQDHELIDFDDMIYAPLIHNVRCWQNDWVLVDEAQDTNPARRAFAKKILRPGGRLIAVGDHAQAIYGFTGADNDALEIIRTEFDALQLPLTVTYRCPKQVVQAARYYVQHITAADSAPEGRVSAMSLADFDSAALNVTDAVLCRNTKPLVELAFLLIRQSIPCRVEGRDIGRGLVALVNRWRVKSLPTLVERLEAYQTREVSKLMAKGQEARAGALADRVETLLVLISGQPVGASVADLRASITALFEDSEGADRPAVTLSTIHKAKGREWTRVWLWGQDKFIPSFYARQTWQQEQEMHLAYVAITRAMGELVFVNHKS